MTKTGFIGCGLALALLIATGCGPLPPLQLSLKPDGVQVYRLYLDTYDNFRAQGQYHPSNETHLIIDWEQTVLPPVQPDIYRLQLVFRRIQMQEEAIDRQGGNRFDTEQVDQAVPEAYRPFFGMLDKPLILTIDSQGKITGVEGFEAVETAMAGLLPKNEKPDRWKPYFRQAFGPDFLAELYGPFLAGYPLPEDRGKPQWERSRLLYSPLFGRLSFDQKNVLVDPKNRTALIQFEGLIHAQPAAAGDLPQKQDGKPNAGQEEPKPDYYQGKVTGTLGADRKTGLLNEYSQETMIYTIDGNNPKGKPYRRLTIITHLELL